VVDDLGRDASLKKVPKKIRYIEDHHSNGYYFRTWINEKEIDCMIDMLSAAPESIIQSISLSLIHVLK
jgi:hypothetical protein